ncbi:LOW QUALITY PROTEIN: uncharacterized protein LOC105423127 [Pogonomyrmex barbatus]|uniref:LOW QUALITY PROTEIN: uncharacterized protein LOC105423127 n=1 Tax=Pogonomyrmex barbatus TaxID=144034 RepID=A0A8N1S4T5_9HYME|nr:LOW QUALITY PROTEIN: uncharacterized protein LOC105423127 [Pogonomyrmex barbatus]
MLKKVEWYLMGAMSFLIPYISHRRGRSSMGNVNFSTSSTLSTSSEISSPISSQPSISSKVCNIDFVQNDSVDIVVDDTSSTNESTACSDSTTVEIKPETKSVLLKKKKVIPDLDIFAKKNKKNDVENLLAQSTSALTNLATVVHKSISESVSNKINEHKYKSNPYAESILVAFDQVPVIKQVDCLIATLNVIKSYQALQADLVQH